MSNGQRLREGSLGSSMFFSSYFIFCVDSSESELGILDLIQVLVETLDRCFENVCELDLIFHVDKVHFILNEMIMGGMVLETSLQEIVSRFHEQQKIAKSEVSIIPSQISEKFSKMGPIPRFGFMK